ncbi:MAG: cell division protein FtsZ [Candidatus Binatia bacterium]|jgi:cell division protein FtsZ|nr:cell division protein FtsZ [Candidatus Binatia bacterium]
MFEIVEENQLGARIKAIGIGGGGGNAINTMIGGRLAGVNFIVANTDAQALEASAADVKVQLGEKITKGLGAGADPEIGRRAALEDQDCLREYLTGADMVFITAGMGGGTGTGGAPIIAKVARDEGALTVGVVTKPFVFEGKRRLRQAEEGIRELKDNVDTLIVIPNQRLLGITGKDTPLIETFKMADSVLLQAVRGISDLIVTPGLINLDFADVRTVMAEMGFALMGASSASGENRALEAAQKAISSPLLEDISISGARGILINITGSSDLSLHEVNEAATMIQEEAHEEANIIFGAVIDETEKDEIRITVIATGFGEKEKEREWNKEVVNGTATRVRHRDNKGNKKVVHLGTIVDDLDSPTWQRRTKDKDAAETPRPEKALELSEEQSEEVFDIPTFLRKQMD